MDDDIFSDMHETLFAALGKGVFLRNGEACSAELREGEQITSEDGQVVGYHTTADIWYKDLVAKPRAGDKLTVDAVEYSLDFIVKDDGYSARWVIV